MKLCPEGQRCLLWKQLEGVVVFSGLIAATIYSCKDTGGVMRAGVVELEKAYNHIALGNLWGVLEKYEVPEPLL